MENMLVGGRALNGLCWSLFRATPTIVPFRSLIMKLWPPLTYLSQLIFWSSTKAEYGIFNVMYLWMMFFSAKLHASILKKQTKQKKNYSLKNRSQKLCFSSSKIAGNWTYWIASRLCSIFNGSTMKFLFFSHAESISDTFALISTMQLRICAKFRAEMKSAISIA